MKSERKKMIISEIEYWKRHHLLPAHYCDFLITLYSGGEATAERDERNHKRSVLHYENRNKKWLLTSLSIVVSCLCASLFFLPEYSMWVLGLTGIVFCSVLLYALRQTFTQSSNSLLYILCAFMLLAASFKLWQLLFVENTLLLICILFMNCLLWILTGRLLRLLHFTLAGLTGMMLLVGTLFSRF